MFNIFDWAEDTDNLAKFGGRFLLIVFLMMGGMVAFVASAIAWPAATLTIGGLLLLSYLFWSCLPEKEDE